MRRRTAEEKKRWRRESKREQLEGYPHVWVEGVNEYGQRDWALTVRTDEHTYVRLAAGEPYQYGNESTYVELLLSVDEFLAVKG